MAKIKEAARWFSDAVETACGWALLALVLYALFFVDLTGQGSAWVALRGVAHEVVPVERVSLLQREDSIGRDRMLIASGGQEEAAPAAAQVRPAAALTDAPAERAATGDWKAHLTGKLRSFSVYGRGEQTSSASVSAAPAYSASRESASPAGAVAPTASVPGSAYRAGVAAPARPGISTRVSRVASGPADSVRNFSGR